jgi:hypothetical protein
MRHGSVQGAATRLHRGAAMDDASTHVCVETLDAYIAARDNTSLRRKLDLRHVSLQRVTEGRVAPGNGWFASWDAYIAPA